MRVIETSPAPAQPPPFARSARSARSDDAATAGSHLWISGPPATWLHTGCTAG